MPVSADATAKLVLLPLLVAQALRAKQQALGLPEPAGPREGIIGSGPPLRLLLTGDSSAAGVGTDTQDQALSGQLSAILARHYRVEWKLVAKTGAMTKDATLRLQRLPTQPFDMAVVCLGVNDVTSNVLLHTWLKRQAALFDLLQSKFGVKRIYVSGLPPVRHFPLLPQPLRWVLGRQAQRFDQHLADLTATHPECDHIRFDLPFDPKMMSEDGFHPGPAAYAAWGRLLGRHIEADIAKGIAI